MGSLNLAPNHNFNGKLIKLPLFPSAHVHGKGTFSDDFVTKYTAACGSEFFCENLSIFDGTRWLTFLTALYTVLAILKTVTSLKLQHNKFEKL